MSPTLVLRKERERGARFFGEKGRKKFKTRSGVSRGGRKSQRNKNKKERECSNRRISPFVLLRVLQVNAEYFGGVVQYASKLFELVLVLLKHLDT